MLKGMPAQISSNPKCSHISEKWLPLLPGLHNLQVQYIFPDSACKWDYECNKASPDEYTSFKCCYLVEVS